MKIVIAGLGSIGRKHLNAILKLAPKSTIYALRSSRNSQNEEGVINIYDVDSLSKIDFAIIATPTANHLQSITQLQKLNCPLFIEKPIYHNLEIQSIVEEIGTKQLTYIACNLRFLDCLSFVKQKIEFNDNRINEINVYCGSYLPDWRPNRDYKELYSANLNEGGGVHLDLIHELDYLYWFFGKPKSAKNLLKQKSSLNINAPDYANYCLDYDTFCANVVLNYYRRDTKRSLEIVFEDYTWNVNLLSNKVYQNGEVIFESQQSIKDTYDKQLSYYLNLLETGSKTSINTIADALNVLKICLESC